MILRSRTMCLMLAFGAAACGGATEQSEDSQIVATTTIWADITSELLCGAEVPAIVPSGADPHTFEPPLQARRAVENSAVLIANGGGLEDGLLDLIETAPRVVSMTEVVPTFDGDPHVWQDPTRVVTAIDAIVDAIGEQDASCGDAYRAELSALDADITKILAPIPPSDRAIVTSHDSLAYFADRYDLEIVGTVIPSTSTLAATNATELAELADLIEARGVRAIFTERLASTADANALAARLGVDVVPLVTDALTEDPDTDTYAGMMRSNALAIASALTP